MVSRILLEPFEVLICKLQNPFCTKVANPWKPFLVWWNKERSDINHACLIWKDRHTEDIPTWSFDDGCVTPLKLNNVGIIHTFKQPQCEYLVVVNAWNGHKMQCVSNFSVRKRDWWSFTVLLCYIVFCANSSAGHGSEEEKGGSRRQQHIHHSRDVEAAASACLGKRMEELEKVGFPNWCFEPVVLALHRVRYSRQS